MNNKKHKPRTYFRSGVSLAELAIVSALILVLSYMGYTNFSDMAKSQAAKSGASQIAYAVRKAKHYARSKGVATTLTFTAGSSTYDISAGGVSLINSNNFGTTSGKFPDNVTITSSTCSDIGFDVDGTLTDSSGNIVYNSCTVTIGSSGGSSQTVTINGKTGAIKYD